MFGAACCYAQPWHCKYCITCCSPSQPSHHAMVLGAISSDPQRGWIIISLAPSHHCPGHSGELVGKRETWQWLNVVDLP